MSKGKGATYHGSRRDKRKGEGGKNIYPIDKARRKLHDQRGGIFTHRHIVCSCCGGFIQAEAMDAEERDAFAMFHAAYMDVAGDKEEADRLTCNLFECIGPDRADVIALAERLRGKPSDEMVRNAQGWGARLLMARMQQSGKWEAMDESTRRVVQEQAAQCAALREIP